VGDGRRGIRKKQLEKTSRQTQEEEFETTRKTDRSPWQQAGRQKHPKKGMTGWWYTVGYVAYSTRLLVPARRLLEDVPLVRENNKITNTYIQVADKKRARLSHIKTSVAASYPPRITLHSL
jgi:hypothetical protein